MNTVLNQVKKSVIHYELNVLAAKLNAYNGDDIWNDIIYGYTIGGKPIADKTYQISSGDMIFFEGTDLVVVHEHRIDEWIVK